MHFAFSIPLFLLLRFALGQRRPQLPQLAITDEEIEQFVDELWEQNPPMDVPVNFQGHTSARDPKDQAERPFFQNVALSDLTGRWNSVRKLIKLYDNYEPQTGEPERETAEEEQEIAEFLDAILDSQPMEQLYSLLREKGHPFAENEATFRRWIGQIWFGQYSRARGAPDSSGFEHVFIGEFKNGEVSGLHSWIRFLFLEKTGRSRFDYRGFLVKRDNIFAALKFSWAGQMKPTGSFLIGTAPEFDFAIYSLCFLARRGGGSRSCNVVEILRIGQSVGDVSLPAVSLPATLTSHNSAKKKLSEKILSYDSSKSLAMKRPAMKRPPAIGQYLSN